ncbi:hypothetical protein H6B11_05220 [Mediterraneibacter glycyrrhizinilyticus]|nr:DUF6147 family protein [Mediterraneibacter glycyrrhizinilyticus]MBM6853563.1 hypothetical protein [Mediterraneibacter glycyrrhizinilyticus]
MKKKILSIITSMAIFFGMFSVSVTNVQASENETKKVDGSYLTMDEYSKGTSSNDHLRGIHMMTGECSITKAGRDEIYCYGATTGNHEVDKLAVVVYVDQYQEDLDEWWQIDWWYEEATDDYFVHTDKTLEVDRGYYYRVHADHFVAEGEDPIEETFTFTDGIYLPE